MILAFQESLAVTADREDEKASVRRTLQVLHETRASDEVGSTSTKAEAQINALVFKVPPDSSLFLLKQTNMATALKLETKTPLLCYLFASCYQGVSPQGV